VKRRLFNLAAAVSALICATTLTLWVHSYWREDGVGWHSNHLANDRARMRHAFAHSTLGTIWIEVSWENVTIVPGTYPGPTSGSESGFNWHSGPTRPPRFLQNLFYDRSGFAFESYWNRPNRRSNFTGIESGVRLVLPHWFVAVLSVILPDLSWRGRKRRLRQHRLAHKLCVACGYDLRATPQAGGALLHRCPECGTKAEQAKPQPAEGASA
jgi:hypothetical protein